MLYINDRLSMMGSDNRVYRYTINTEEHGVLGLLHVTNIFEIGIRKALTFIESNCGYINSYNGFIFFKRKEYAEMFIDLINNYRKTNNH